MSVGSYNLTKNYDRSQDKINQAIATCTRNMDVSLGACIYKIGMEDPAESERSVLFQFTPEESAEILKTVKKVLTKSVSVQKAGT